MLSNVESEKIINGESNSGQLLRDIESIGKALYLHKAPPKGLISPSDSRSKSAGRTRVFQSKSNSNADINNGNVLHKGKKSSMWNWKRPLKALSHIRDQKFNCCFYLHVHSIEGLPSIFNDLGVCVYWKRKEEVLRTQPSRVDQGMAEFEETLMHQCTVYGHRSGTHHSAKYEVKLFLVYASIVGADGLDIGKHWVDLTRLLPLTLEELEEERSSGKWTTSFKLTGKAKGATLNVSFGYSVMRNTYVVAYDNVGVPLLSNLDRDRSSTVANVGSSGHGMLRRVGSVPSMVNHESYLPSQSMDMKILFENLTNPGLTLSRSINLLYQKLDDAKCGNSTEFGLLSERSKLEPGSSFESAAEHLGDECDDIEFTVVEQGIEFSTNEQSKLDKGADQTFDCSFVNIIHAAETIKDDEVCTDEVTRYNSKDDVMNSCKNEEDNVYGGKSAIEELECGVDSLLQPQSMNLSSPLTLSEILSHESHMEEKHLLRKENFLEDEQNCKASTMVKSFSLDDIIESVASDFFSMLEVECSPHGLSSDSDPESPRERLLRQFEKEALASGNFIFNDDSKEKEVEFECPEQAISGIKDFPEDSEFSLVIQGAEQEHRKGRKSQSLMSIRKAKLLEKLETETLMQEWGMNERAFQNSPRCSSGGFGSPIYILPEEPVKLPPLGEGLGPLLQTKEGGFLRSMNPSLFRNAKNGGSLIMQVSSPVVLPVELGSDIIEILQHLASIGIEKLSKQLNHLMPLEDITGKTMQQVAMEASSTLEVLESGRMDLHEVEQRSFGKRNKAKVLPSVQNYTCLYSSSVSGERNADYTSLRDIAPLAMEKIEALSIDGLRIQSGMYGKEAPSSIHPRGLNSANFGVPLSPGGAKGSELSEFGIDVDGLLGLSITLDEWLRLDAGIFSEEDYVSEHMLKTLAAHHARCTDFSGERLTREGNWDIASDRRWGSLGNNLTVALLMQLRDPLRNYEPVGAPLLALIQVERVYASPKHGVYCLMTESHIENNGQYFPLVVDERDDERHKEMKDEEEGEQEEENKGKKGGEEDGPQFKINEVHVAGLNMEPEKKQFWGSTTQQQSGYRWLLASGLGRTDKHPFLKSKAVVKSSQLAMGKKQPRDTLWSISTCVLGTGSKEKELEALNIHTRNPDVIFLDETIRL